MKPSYKETLNLPKTDFPMKASLSTREVEQIKYWKEKHLYKKMQEKNANNPYFILHDGPPYANGHLHVGHSLNKILKDIIVKYKSKQGFASPYIPGWDCHGLPIEIQAQKKLKSPYSKNELRDACKVHAENFIRIQKEEFERLMIFADYENRYATSDYIYESQILSVLRTAVQKKLVYRENRPVHWCIHCATALADAEIEYALQESPSLYLSFPVQGQSDLFFLVWTTTPWTLIANVGLAFHKQIEYAIFTADDGKDYILAKDLASVVSEKTGRLLQYKDSLSWQEIEKLTGKHPFLDRESQVIFADHVTLEAGTGIVHTAPSHGEEDFLAGYIQNGLPVIMAINDYGKFIPTPLAPQIDFILGDSIWKANPKIVEKLRDMGHLFFVENFQHSYPHCWRCKNPIIIRTTFQWFIRVSQLVPQMLQQIEHSVQFVPIDRKERMIRIITGRPDWCISRQRVWGVPIPSIRCACGEEFLEDSVLDRVQHKVEKQGANFWFDPHTSLLDICPEMNDRVCSVCGQTGNYTRGQDILDVWFDSGVSWKNLLEEKLHLTKQTDIQLYLEGNDQFRAWYQVSLITALMEKERAPYKAILTHGMVLDEQGKAMSKSVGNVLSPLDIAQDYGADILRLWVVSQTYTEDTRIGKNILDQMSDAYRKIRNTFRFLLSNLFDYTHQDFLAMDLAQLQEIDCWVLYKLEALQKKVYQAYDEYSFDTVFREIFVFMNEDLSSFYLDVLKDPLYTLAPDDIVRKSAQYSMVYITQVLADLLCPILSFTAEEVYQNLPLTIGFKEKSIFLSKIVELNFMNLYMKNAQNVDKVLSIRLKVLKELEFLRQQKVIGSNLEAKVLLKTSDEEILSCQNLDFYFIVSEVEVVKSDTDLEIIATKVQKYKCPRCYRYVSLQPEELCGRCLEVLR